MASGVNSTALQAGLWLIGEYLGVKREEGRPRDDRDPSKGSWPDRYKVGIRVGSDVFDVEYRTVDAAEAALAAHNESVPSKGSPAILPVRARAAKGFVFWVGSGEAAAMGDYE